jgi:hypothetical protein
MEGGLALVLWTLVIFQTKHALIDFVLQPRYDLRRGETYLQRARVVYAALHALGSLPAVLMLANSTTVLALAFGAELVLVYHAAWLRDRMMPRIGDPDDVAATALFGAEQFLHQLFYIAAIALLI